MPLQNVLRNSNKSLFGERPIVRPLRVQFVAVAGGGGGTAQAENGNGGGAGGVITGSFCVQRDTTYNIVVGDGGAPFLGPNPTADKGENTELFGVVALGGGAYDDADNPNILNGGSGAGGVLTAGVGLQPTASYSGFGNDGAAAIGGAGGGGAGSAGGTIPAGQPVTESTSRDAGWGIIPSLLDDYTIGVNRWLGQGGQGISIQSGSGRPAPDDGSAPSPQFPAYGRGGSGGYSNAPQVQPTSGSSGVVFIRYSGTPILQGGDSTVTNNGYTYHVYSSVGTGSLSFIPGKNQDNFAIDNCNDGQSVPI